MRFQTGERGLSAPSCAGRAIHPRGYFDQGNMTVWGEL
jgi:hypothetical protein